MKKLNAVLALVAILILTSITPTALAGPPIYNISVSATSTNTVVTPTASFGKPTTVTVTNDGATTVFLDLDRVAVAASTTAIQIKACEGVTVNVEANTSFTTLGLITASGTTTAQVTVGYQAGTYPQVTPTAARIVRFANPGCSTTSGVGPTANGASWLPFVNSEQITLATGALVTDSSANLLPANSLIDAVVCRQTTAITTSTNWGISVSRGCSPEMQFVVNNVYQGSKK